MGTIQTTVGLITGLNIQDLVDKLIAISARPRQMLEERNKTLQAQQTALGTLAGLLYSVKMPIANLGKTETYQQRQVSSSAPDVLEVTKTGTPALGRYEITPIRMAQTHKLLSAGFRSAQEALGLQGTMTIRFGDHVERGLSLSLLNGGDGIQRGKIRIVDRSGAWADIDLSTAQTIDDVLDAINSNTTVNVMASVRDGRIRLEDQTGQTISNLKVLEVRGGRTAESLGLAGINVPENTAEGEDILRLFNKIDLNVLNDGAGISLSTSLPEISYTLRDGTTGEINFASTGTREVTLEQILEKIQQQSHGKIRAEIGSDGRRLVLTDTTSGSGTFSLNALYGTKTLADLGLDTQVVDGVITGRRILSGLRTVALRSLNGGNGLGQLGLLSLTDRSGASDTVDLSTAETLEDVVEAINLASVSILARINSARNGIELVDTSGSSVSNLIVANGDGTNTADKLQIAVNAAVNSVNSGDLHLRILSENTLLSTLNGGAGVAKGQFYIRDSSGRMTTIDLRSSSIQTVGDVIRTINAKALYVRAEINATGDGILLRDTAGGSGKLTVSEAGSTTAKDLGLLLRPAQTVEEGGHVYQVIDGSLTYAISLASTDTLENLQTKINAVKGGFTASLLNDGSVWPWRLALVSQRSGKIGGLVVDTSSLAFSFQETSAPQDAQLIYGPASSAASAMVIRSSSNTFTNVIDGTSLQIKQATGNTVSVTVSPSNAVLLASITSFVENYNKFRDQLSQYTKYDPSLGKGSVLTGDSTALRFETSLSSLLSGRFTSQSQFQSLAALGIELTEEGKLQFDQEKFEAAYAKDPQGVQEFFAAPETGMAHRLSALIEQLAGEGNSTISQRLEALDSKISTHRERIEHMTTLLDKERTRLLTQFYHMELAVSKIQSSLSTLDSISWITQQYTNTRRNNR